MPGWYISVFLTWTVTSSPAWIGHVDGAVVPGASSWHSSSGASTVWIGPGPNWVSQLFTFLKDNHSPSSPMKKGNLSGAEDHMSARCSEAM